MGNKTSLNLLLLYLCAFCFGAGHIASNSSAIIKSTINGGITAALRRVPWHAGVYSKRYTPYMQICGATVVTKQVVLTAAHCFTKDRVVPHASWFAVGAGKIYRPWNNRINVHAQKSDVKEIIIPPRYQGNAANYQDDIAVVILTNLFLFNGFVEPACVNFNLDYEEMQLREGELGQIAGWGQTEANAPASQVLKVASLPTIAINKCIEQSPVSFRSAITGDKICTGYYNGTAVCHGGSGGGLVFPGKIGNRIRMFLRGVASTSPPDENSCNIYTWATFTHLLRHEHFIKAAVPDIEDACDEYFVYVLSGQTLQCCPCS